MEEIIKLIANSLDIQVEDIKIDAEIRDIVADSLDRIELIMTFEDEFDIDIPDADIDKLLTVRDIVEYITEKTASVGIER